MIQTAEAMSDLQGRSGMPARPAGESVQMPQAARQNVLDDPQASDQIELLIDHPQRAGGRGARRLSGCQVVPPQAYGPAETGVNRESKPVGGWSSGAGAADHCHKLPDRMARERSFKAQRGPKSCSRSQG